MSEIRKDFLYTKDHEWIAKTEQANTVRIGITDFAQSSLGDVTFVELPDVGTTLEAGQTFGSVESVKAVSDLFAPVSGKVSKINEAINDDPSVVNTSPFDQAWMIEIELTNETEMSNLMQADAYKTIAI